MEQINLKKITLDGVEYVRASDITNQPAQPNSDGLKYVIVRTRSAGVFAGYLQSQVGQEVDMVEARRIWYWAGAASLSQLAVDGTSKPNECKFPAPVTVHLTEAIETIDCTEKARLSITGVKEWKA